MASSLSSIPAEISLSILSSLSFTDLHALSLVNKNLRCLAEPFLYSNIKWKCIQSRLPPVVPLVQSILRRPELGSFVKSIILDNWIYERNDDRARLASPKLTVTESELNAPIEWIRKTDVPFGDLWIQELRAGSVEAFVAVLLSRLPCLESLYLGKSLNRENHLIGKMFRSAVCGKVIDGGLPSYECLRNVSTVYFPAEKFAHREPDARNTADVLSLLYLPSVERITASIDNPAIFAWPRALPPNPSKLIALDLTMIREGHLGQVLSVTSELRDLRWHWYFHRDLQDRFVSQNIDLSQVAADLSHARRTLVVLNITASVDSPPNDLRLPPPLRVTGQFKAFSNFDALKHLEIPLVFLLGFSPSAPNIPRLKDVLPKNLDMLIVTDDLSDGEEWDWTDIDLLANMRLWLEDWKNPHPRTFFYVHSKVNHYMEWGSEARLELRKLGAQVGMHVQVFGM